MSAWFAPVPLASGMVLVAEITEDAEASPTVLDSADETFTPIVEVRDMCSPSCRGFRGRLYPIVRGPAVQLGLRVVVVRVAAIDFDNQLQAFTTLVAA